MIGKRYRVTGQLTGADKDKVWGVSLGAPLTDKSVLNYDSLTGIISGEVEPAQTNQLIFIFDGTTVWSNVIISSLNVTPIGCLAEYTAENAGAYTLFDNMNNLNGTVNGGAIAASKDLFPLYRDGIMARTTDWTATNVVPKGYVLKAIVVTNNTATPMTTNVGTTGGGTDVVSGATITASVTTVISVNKLFSYTADQTLYFDDSGGWQSVNIRLIMEKM